MEYIIETPTQRGIRMHAEVKADYFGKRESAAARFVASISKDGIEFESTTRIIERGHAKKMDAFYYDEDAGIIHIVDFKTGDEYVATDNQMAMYVFAVEREYKTVKNNIQIIVHVFYFDHPEFNSSTEIPMDVEYIVTEFYNRNPKMAAEMHGIRDDKDASKARTKERQGTEEYIEAAKASKRVYNNSDKGKARSKKYNDGSASQITGNQRAVNRRAKRKADKKAGIETPKRVYTVSKVVKAKRASFKETMANIPPVIIY